LRILTTDERHGSALTPQLRRARLGATHTMRLALRMLVLIATVLGLGVAFAWAWDRSDAHAESQVSSSIRTPG
jgi:hypothetical protein